MILAESFNVNFVTSMPFTIFLKRQFDLWKSIIRRLYLQQDMEQQSIFSGYLDNITSNTSSTAIITEITEDTTITFRNCVVRKPILKIFICLVFIFCMYYYNKNNIRKMYLFYKTNPLIYFTPYLVLGFL